MEAGASGYPKVLEPQVSRPADVHQRCGKGVQLSDAELARVQRNLVSHATQFLFYESGPKKGNLFFKEQGRKLTSIDAVINRHLPLNSIALIEDEGPLPTPVDAAKESDF